VEIHDADDSEPFDLAGLVYAVIAGPWPDADRSGIRPPANRSHLCGSEICSIPNARLLEQRVKFAICLGDVVTADLLVFLAGKHLGQNVADFNLVS
jgi:hypothetical protein